MTLVNRRDLTFVAFGDSVTLGARAKSGATPGVADWETFHYRTWNRLLQSRRAGTRNAGVGGDDTALALTRFSADVLAYRPDLVTVMFGINDSWHDAGAGVGAPRVALSAYETNLTSIVSQLMDAGARVLVCTPNKMSDAPRDADMAPYVVKARDVAAATGASLVDVYAAFDANPSFAADWLLDSMHPRGTGHAQIASLIAVAVP